MSESAFRRISVRPITGIGRSLTYRLPRGWQGELAIGLLVRIPLGNRTCFGVIESLEGDADVPAERLKAILGAVYPQPVVTAELVQLATWIQRYYAASWEATYEALLPAVIRQGIKPKV